MKFLVFEASNINIGSNGWQTMVIAQVSSESCFCKVHKLRKFFTFLKCYFLKGIYDRDPMWPIKPKVFTIWSFTEKFGNF